MTTIAMKRNTMPDEIERKFLVKDGSWRPFATGSKLLCQAYLARTPTLETRIRLTDDALAAITIKSTGSALSRQEFEYAIPVTDALALMKLTLGPPIRKRRFTVPANPGTWEIDVFEDAHAGLTLAEIELPNENTEFARPDWLGEEVTGDPRYYNITLADLSGRDDK